MNHKYYLHFLMFALIFPVLGMIGGKNLSLFSTVRAQPNGEIKSNKNAELNVTTVFWKKQQTKAMEPRKAPTGTNPKGLVVTEELRGDGVVKQKAKLSEMVTNGYTMPLDFTDLAEKRMKGELVELPAATESYFLAVGGNATDEEFTSYSFEDGSVALKPDSPKYLTIKNLADDFDGMKYDLNNPKDRKQIRIRLLRMVNPQTKQALEEIAAAYQKKFARPLRVVSLIRSMEYQVELNKTNSNSFRVSGTGSLPPHTSGAAFDIARTNLTAAEQNFIISKLAEMERQGKMDALIEYGVNPVFHIFVYADGKPPKVVPKMEPEETEN